MRKLINSARAFGSHHRSDRSSSFCTATSTCYYSGSHCWRTTHWQLVVNSDYCCPTLDSSWCQAVLCSRGSVTMNSWIVDREMLYSSVPAASLSVPCCLWQQRLDAARIAKSYQRMKSCCSWKGATCSSWGLLGCCWCRAGCWDLPMLDCLSSSQCCWRRWCCLK